ARLEAAEALRIRRLLELALGMAEATEQCLAVEHYGSVGGEDEIGHAGRRVQLLDGCAMLGEGATQLRPLAHSGGVQRAAAFSPGVRIHPGIDAVGDREMLRTAHQIARRRAFDWRRA